MPTTPDPFATFIARWQGAEAAERANYALFLVELRALLGVDPPDPAAGPYRLERGVTRTDDDGTASAGFISL